MCPLKENFIPWFCLVETDILISKDYFCILGFSGTRYIYTLRDLKNKYDASHPLKNNSGKQKQIYQRLSYIKVSTPEKDLYIYIY